MRNVFVLFLSLVTLSFISCDTSDSPGSSTEIPSGIIGDYGPVFPTELVILHTESKLELDSMQGIIRSIPTSFYKLNDSLIFFQVPVNIEDGLAKLEIEELDVDYEIEILKKDSNSLSEIDFSSLLDDYLLKIDELAQSGRISTIQELAFENEAALLLSRFQIQNPSSRSITLESINSNLPGLLGYSDRIRLLKENAIELRSTQEIFGCGSNLISDNFDCLSNDFNSNSSDLIVYSRLLEEAKNRINDGSQALFLEFYFFALRVEVFDFLFAWKSFLLVPVIAEKVNFQISGSPPTSSYTFPEGQSRPVRVTTERRNILFNSDRNQGQQFYQKVKSQFERFEEYWSNYASIITNESFFSENSFRTVLEAESFESIKLIGISDPNIEGELSQAANNVEIVFTATPFTSPGDFTFLINYDDGYHSLTTDPINARFTQNGTSCNFIAGGLDLDQIPNSSNDTCRFSSPFKNRIVIKGLDVSLIAHKEVQQFGKVYILEGSISFDSAMAYNNNVLVEQTGPLSINFDRAQHRMNSGYLPSQFDRKLRLLYSKECGVTISVFDIPAVISESQGIFEPCQ